MVEDIGEASYNTFRAVKFVSLINQVDMSLAVARNTGKEAKYSNTPPKQYNETMNINTYHQPSPKLRKRTKSDTSNIVDELYVGGNYGYSHQNDRHHKDDDSMSSFNHSVFSDKNISNALDRVGRKYSTVQAEVLYNENLNLTNNRRNSFKRMHRRSRRKYTKTIAKNLPLKVFANNDSCSESVNSMSLSGYDQLREQ